MKTKTTKASVKNVEPETTTAVAAEVAVVEEPKTKRTRKSKKETWEVAEDVKGNIYEVCKETKKCRKLNQFSELKVDDLDLPEMDLQVYQKYLHDKFNEDCPIKKGKLNFRGYRISCTKEDGFVVEDTTKHYQIVDTPFDGIPTPRELGDWFKKPTKREFSDEELKAAVERGKAKEAKVENEEPKELSVDDLEKLRKKVINKIKRVQNGVDPKFDPMQFVDMLPFKKWQRKCRAITKQWLNKEIRYPKFLKGLLEITETIKFVEEEKAHRSTFKGTSLPEFNYVGSLVKDKLEVDGKLVDAVPFLVNYFLYYKPGMMPQLMKWNRGEINDMEFVSNPLEKDWKEEFSSRIENSEHRAQILIAAAYEAGELAPQDLLYPNQCSLKVGDKVFVSIDDKWKKREIKSADNEGIVLKGDIWLTKESKWIKAE